MVKKKTPQQFLSEYKEKLEKHNKKVAKAEALIARRKASVDKLLASYAKEEDACSVIPCELLADFRYLSYREEQELYSRLGASLACPRIYRAGLAYREARNRLYHEFGVDWSSVSSMSEEEYQEMRARQDRMEASAGWQLLRHIYNDYMCKIDDLVESIGAKEQELAELRARIIKVSERIAAAKTEHKRMTDLFTQVPELGRFINRVAKKMLEAQLQRRNQLVAAMAEWEEGLEKLEKRYGTDSFCAMRWPNRSTEMCAAFRAHLKTKPQRALSEDQIRRLIADWINSERALMAERIYTEFGTVTSAELHVGADGNVNGTITGTEGSARLETIFAGGYNIQRLHTRLLFHELKKD